MDKALELAQTAYSKLPNSPEVGDTLGFIYYKKDLLPQATRSAAGRCCQASGKAAYQTITSALPSPRTATKRVRPSTCSGPSRFQPDFESAADAKAVLPEPRDRQVPLRSAPGLDVDGSPSAADSLFAASDADTA